MSVIVSLCVIRIEICGDLTDIKLQGKFTIHSQLTINKTYIFLLQNFACF